MTSPRLQEVVERLWAVQAVGDEMAEVLTVMAGILGAEEDIVVDIIGPLLSEWRTLRGVD